MHKHLKNANEIIRSGWTVNISPNWTVGLDNQHNNDNSETNKNPEKWKRTIKTATTTKQQQKQQQQQQKPRGNTLQEVGGKCKLGQKFDNEVN